MIDWESNMCHWKKMHNYMSRCTTYTTAPQLWLLIEVLYKVIQILHMPGHRLYSLGHAPPSWVGLGKWLHGLTPKITLCDVCTTCLNLVWECHMWQVMPVIYKIKRSVKLQINLGKSVNNWGGVWDIPSNILEVGVTMPPPTARLHSHPWPEGNVGHCSCSTIASLTDVYIMCLSMTY